MGAARGRDGSLVRKGPEKGDRFNFYEALTYW